MSTSSAKKIYVELTFGHRATLREKGFNGKFTHDWEVFVRSDQGVVEAFVDKVIFQLHETYRNPRRVIREPPFCIKESGFAGFIIDIEVCFKNKDEPRKTKFAYDLFLQSSGPTINHSKKEQLVFDYPQNEDFAKRLFEGGGVLRKEKDGNRSDSLVASSSSHLSPHSGGKSLKHSSTNSAKAIPNDSFEKLLRPPIKRGGSGSPSLTSTTVWANDTAKRASNVPKERKLTDTEFIAIAKEVKAQQCLWDVANPSHKNSEAIQSAWVCVSTKTTLTVDECKRGWESLRNKLRCALGGKQKDVGLFGDSGGEESQPDLTWSEDNERLVDSLMFGDFLSFIANKPLKRSALSSDPLYRDSPIESPVSDAGRLENSYAWSDTSSTSTSVVASEWSNSNYGNATKKRKLGDIGEKLVNTIAELVTIREGQKGNQMFKHQAMLANLDQMLSKLPEEAVEDLSFEFVKMTHDKLKQHRNS